MSNRPSKALLKEWDARLKLSGFEDAEGGMVNGNNSCFSDGRMSTARRMEYFLDSEEYFRLAGLFFHHHKFESPRDKYVWRLHSEGFSTRAISKETKVYVKTVQKLIRDMRKLMACMKIEDEE
jgi:hypothetical protein